MRRWLASLLAVLGLAALASAQCCATLPIPKAPDMRGPGYYYWNCQGQLYGPVHYVRPPFEPFQGMIPGPNAAKCYADYGMQPGYAAGQQQGGNGNGAGYPGLWFHPNVRSPRDFFMMGNDPAASPYRYGGGASASPGYSLTDR